MSQNFPQTQLQHAEYHLANEKTGKRYELCGSKELYPGYDFIQYLSIHMLYFSFVKNLISTKIYLLIKS